MITYTPLLLRVRGKLVSMAEAKLIVPHVTKLLRLGCSSTSSTSVVSCVPDSLAVRRESGQTA